MQEAFSDLAEIQCNPKTGEILNPATAILVVRRILKEHDASIENWSDAKVLALATAFTVFVHEAYAQPFSLREN
jgi:hypothetical protein